MTTAGFASGNSTELMATATIQDRTSLFAQQQTVLIVFEVINIFLFVLVLWLLLCLVAYGAKTGRFTKSAQSSSLSDGMIYRVCVVAVLSLLPRLITVEITYIVQRREDSSCWMLGNASVLLYGTSLYGIYMFLWCRQRLIFVHPFVEAKVGRMMAWLSRGYIVYLTAVTITIIAVFFTTEVYYKRDYICYEERPDTSNYLLLGSFLLTQTLMLCLSIYPALRVNIQIPQENRVPNPDCTRHCNEGQQTNSKSSFRRFCTFLSGVVVTSPVERAIKRTIVSSILIATADIAAVTIEAIALPKQTPAVIRHTIEDISCCIDVFCIVGTFGFAFEVLTVLCPSCRKENCKAVRNRPAPTVYPGDSLE